MTGSARDLAVDALAVFRLTRLAVEDEITADARSRWFERHDPGTTKLGYLLTCPWCTGFWVSAAAVAARSLAPGLWEPAAKVLALSAAAGIMHSRGSGF